MRHLTRRSVALGAAVLMAGWLLPATGSSAATPHRAGELPAYQGIPLEGASGGRVDGPMATGENPPGRVTQVAGNAGYEVPTGSTVTVSTDVVLPTVTCNSGSNANFGDVVTSDPAAGVAIGFDTDLQVLSEVLYDSAAGLPSYVGLSTIDPSCTRQFGLGTCYYEGFTGGPVGAGDEVQLTASLSASSTTTSITDLTTGASLSFGGGGVTVSGSSTLVEATDLCFLPGGDSETCSADDGGSDLPPPGYADYNPFSFTDAQVDGTGLGAYLAGADSNGWIEINDVWGATLEGQTTYVGTGNSFTDTNAQLTLPTVSFSQPRVDQPPTGSTATLQFTASLSFASSYPVYLDYATSDGTATAGSNYDEASGILSFAVGGSLTQNVSVTVIPGPEVPVESNVIYMVLGSSNPSYVVGGAQSDGLINEGPVITAVSPNVVPLNGGPGMQLSVSGYDLIHVGQVKFCPTASTGGAACLPGTGLTVESDTSLTVNLPDATDSLPAGSPTVPMDTVAVDGQGVSSPVSQPADVVTFGCDQQAVTDGAWQAAGCLTDEPDGDDVTQQPSAVDGVGVDASRTDDVTYVPGTDQVTSAGTVTVSLPLADNPAVTIFKGQLTKALSGPVTFTVPSGAKIAGIAISGSLTLTPTSLGQATGSVSATLPAILGGGTGTLTFKTATGGNLKSVEISVPKADFMQLFALTNVTLAFNAPGTWKVKATATTGGTTKTKFSGSLVYANNTLKSGSLTVDTISLAGMVTISNLGVSYSGGNWSGSATIEQAKQTGSVAVNFSGGTLTSASIKTGAVALFGLVNVNTFDLEYAGSGWSLSVASTLAGGGTASGSLSVSGGVISQASLTLTKFALATSVEIATATVSYSASAPNPACSSITTGTEIWCGAWEVELPQATTVNGVSGSLAFADGSFVQGSVVVKGSVPLLDGVFLTQLGASLKVNPTVVGGTATISFGPEISGTSVLSVSGNLTRTYPSGATLGKYEASGTVTALSGSSHELVLGSAAISVPDSGKTTVSLTLGGGTSGLSVSIAGATATITGTVTGSFTGSTFSLSGATTVSVPLFPNLSGNLKADNVGVAACAKTSGGKQVGFEYTWSTGTLGVLDTSGCSEKGF